MAKKNIKLGIFFILLIAMAMSVSAVDVTTCQTLASNTEYTLTTNVTSAVNVDCFNFPSSSSNITLDCDNYWIEGNAITTLFRFGIDLYGENHTIRNCNIRGYGTSWSIYGRDLSKNILIENIYSDNDALSISDGSNYVANNITGENNVITLIKDSSNITLTNLNGSIVFNTASGTPHHIIIDDWDSNPFNKSLFGEGSHDIYINGMRRIDDTKQFQIYADNITINNSLMLRDNGVIQFRGQRQNILVNNLTVRDLVSDSAIQVVSEGFIYTADNVEISNSYFENCTNPAAYILLLYNLTNSKIHDIYMEDVMISTTCFNCVNTRFYNNVINGSHHGLMFEAETTNSSMYNNTVYDSRFNFLLRGGSYGNRLFNNTALGGGIFYSLHGNHDNFIYNNYIESNAILLDAIYGEHWFNNYITGDLILRWDDTGLNISDKGSWNNTIQDTYIGGDFIIQNESVDNSLINVTIMGDIVIDSTSNFSNGWYLDISANTPGTQIVLKDSFDTEILSEEVNDSLSLSRKTVLSYINNGGVITNYSNFTLTGTKNLYYPALELIDLNTNRVISLSLSYIAEEVQACNSISEQIFESFNIGVIALIVLVAALLIGILMTAFGGAGFDSKALMATITLVVLSAIMFVIGIILVGLIQGKLC